jgi:hypothetical protein
MAEQKGFTQNGSLKATTKAGDIVKWLKDDFELGHGHAMAIFALLKGIKNEDSEYIFWPYNILSIHYFRDQRLQIQR